MGVNYGGVAVAIGDVFGLSFPRDADFYDRATGKVLVGSLGP